MNRFLKNNVCFLALFVLTFTALAVAILLTDKAQLHLWFNSCHTAFGDSVLPYYTLIADYGFYLIALALLFWRAGATVYLMIAEGVGAVIVQILKHIICAPRPKLFFDLENNPDALPLVDGVQLHSYYSFPSGHTCTFFILFLCLATLVWYYRQSSLANDKKKETWLNMSLQVLFFILALLGGYSRIYLSQHFATDVFAGGIIGVISVAMLYPAFLWLNNKFPKVCAWHISLPTRGNKSDKQV